MSIAYGLWLIDFAYNVRVVSCIFTFIVMVIMAIYIDKIVTKEDYKKSKVWRKPLTLCILAFTLLCSLVVAIPTKETMYAMLILQDKTSTEVYSITKGEFKETLDYFVESIQKVKGEK